MKTKTISQKVYIASDGKEFSSQSVCEEYEEFLEREAFKDKIDARLSEIEILTQPFYPLDYYIKHDGNIGECKRGVEKSGFNGKRSIRYFEVQSREDLEAIAIWMMSYQTESKKKTRGKYGMTLDSLVKGSKVTKFPDVVCVGTDLGRRHIYSRNTEKEAVKKYLSKMGMEM